MGLETGNHVVIWFLHRAARKSRCMTRNFFLNPGRGVFRLTIERIPLN